MTAVVDNADAGWVTSSEEDPHMGLVDDDDDVLDGDDGVGTTYPHPNDDVVISDLDLLPWWRTGCANTSQFLINLLNMCGWADGQLLPATFRAMEIDLGFTPASLGER